MTYVDASVLVAALTRESTTRRARQWLESRSPSALAVSAWTITEMCSALSIKLRSGAITKSEHEALLGFAQDMMADSMIELPIDRDDFVLAARLSGMAMLGIRAGDALHLAIATRHRTVLATADRQLAEAAEQLNLQTERI